LTILPRSNDKARMADAPAASKGFNRRVLVATGIIFALFILFYFLYQAMYVLLLLFAGTLLAIFLRTLADWLSDWTHLSKRWALFVTVILLIVLGVLR